MRVTHVITRLIVGGAQENTVSTVLGLQGRRELKVDLISGRSVGREGSLEPLFDPYPGILSVCPQLVRPVHPLKDWRALRTLTETFRRTRPDIVHTHSGKAGIIGRMAAGRAGVPLIIHTIHGPSFGSFQGVFANCVFLRAERIAAKVTHHFVVVADAMKTQYMAAGIGEESQYTRIFSGFQLNPFLEAQNDPSFRLRLGLRGDDLVVGTIARLCPLKGHEELFAAAPQIVKSCPRVKFLLVGDGPWRPKLEQKGRALGLAQHFVFAGLIPPAEVPAHIGVMDILIHLSRREGLARALPQALAVGRPVIAFDCDGAREVCLDGQTGYLLRPGDQEALHRRILQLSKDAALRERLGNNGREFVRSRFAVESMVEQIHSLYLRLRTSRVQPAQAATS